MKGLFVLSLVCALRHTVGLRRGQKGEAMEAPTPMEDAFSTDMSQFRSERVKKSFNVSKLLGTWYQVSYVDPAQVGASCQYVVNKINKDGELEQKFAVRYGPIPFPLDFVYERVSQEQDAVYSKYKTGASLLLRLPTAIVDVVDEGNEEGYDFYVEYSKVLFVEEVRFLARVPSVRGERLSQMVRVAEEVGISGDLLKKMTVVDRSNCPPVAEMEMEMAEE